MLTVRYVSSYPNIIKNYRFQTRSECGTMIMDGTPLMHMCLWSILVAVRGRLRNGGSRCAKVHRGCQRRGPRLILALQRPPGAPPQSHRRQLIAPDLSDQRAWPTNERQWLCSMDGTVSDSDLTVHGFGFM